MDWQNRLPIHIIAECRLRVFLMAESLKIVKILNNNAAVCSDGTGTEKIVMGRGLAFQQKTGSIIDTNRIEKFLHFIIRKPAVIFRKLYRIFLWNIFYWQNGLFPMQNKFVKKNSTTVFILHFQITSVRPCTGQNKT